MERSDVKLGKPLLVSAVVIAAMLAVSLWGWVSTPAHMLIPAHWGTNFRPDGYAPKSFGLFMLPGTAAILVMIFAALPTLEPRRANLVASRKLYFAGWYGALAIIAILHLLIVMTAVGFPVDVPRITLFATALLFLVLGNFLGKSRSTFFVGLRLPWTLSSEAAWSKGNRLAGFGLVMTGITTLLALIFTTTILAIVILAGGALLSAVGGGIASYFIWKHDNNKYDGGPVDE